MKDMLDYLPDDVRPLPDLYRARTGHVLKQGSSRVYDKLNDISEYARSNGMRLNHKKTKLMLFNPCISKDFVPLLSLDGIEISMVEETRLLGLVLRSDLSWSSNTDNMVTRSNRKLWFIRRLKKLGASNEDIIDLYQKHVLSILEYAAPVWHSSLTGEDRLKLERIQKSALHIILGENYKSYTSALKLTGMKTLYENRRKIFLKFTRKSLKSLKFRKLFKMNTLETTTRHEQPKYKKVYYRTDRYKNSPISYLTNLCNEMEEQTWSVQD